jgi:DNA polymerase-3 subunit delta
VWNNLSSILDRFRPNIWPFFCLENEWSRGKPAVPKVVTKQKCWQIANKKGWIWQSPGLTKAELHKRIEDWARRHAIIVPQEVVRVLLQVLPLDASSVDHELQKLQLLTGDTKQVCLRDLEIISCHNEMDIFQFLRALESPGRETELWTQIMRNQMASQNNWLLPFLALMLREIRLLWQLVSGEDNKVKLPSNIKREKMELAKRLGHARLVPVWTLLLEAETCLKTGERTPEQAFELLMSGLMQIFASRTSQMSQSFL